MEEQTENKEKQPAGRPAEDSRQAGSATRTERGEGEKRQDREKQPAGRQRQPESRRGQKHGPRRDSSAKASDTRRHTDEPQTADSSLTETEADEAAKLREHTPHTRAEAAAPTPEGAAAAVEEEDDNVATAEEMEAFIRDRREKKEKKEEKREERVDVFGEYTAPENSIDPYLEPDPTLPWVKYEESLFLNRGCRNCPESYVPVSGQETHSCGKVDSCNWMRDIRMPGGNTFPCVEVRFKNNRKEFFRLPEGLEVTEGDVVAVEGMPGHDIGIVSLTGEVCRLQMEKRKVDPESESVRKLFRRAKVSDLDRWNESLQAERSALLRTREIATSLGLEMKINDVEYQGDGTKAIFYYTADDRVDFRTLIKILAEEFHVRVEMKQIGVRQEAGKVGGLGTCGRELCCCTWLTSFKSVTTAAAKAQQILPNPQKLAGQCGKLKCCLNFEYDTYVDALKGFPPAGVALRFEKGLALYKKTDVLRGIMWYGYEGENDLYAIPAERVKEIIEKNRSQEYPERLEDFQVELMSATALTEESSSAEFERELSQMADDRRSGEHDEPAAKADGRRERGAAGKDRRRPRNEGGERRSGSSESQRGGSKSQSDKAPRRPAEGGRPKAPRGEEENPAADSKAGRRHGGPRRGGDSDTPRRSADHDRRG